MYTLRIPGWVLWCSLWWAAISLFGASIWGCATTPPKPGVVVEYPVRNDAEANTLEEGLDAFRTGEYGKAMAVFEFLSESTENEAIYRRALYGLASTRLILAQSAAEFNEAKALWDCWSQQATAEISGEDPRMMTPLLVRIAASIDSGKILKKEGKSKDKTVYKNHLVYRDVVVYKNLLDAKEKEIGRLRSRFEAKEKEVRRLRHQIESLEAIHLKFQEKQKEISSP